MFYKIIQGGIATSTGKFLEAGQVVELTDAEVAEIGVGELIVPTEAPAVVETEEGEGEDKQIKKESTKPVRKARNK